MDSPSKASFKSSAKLIFTLKGNGGTIPNGSEAYGVSSMNIRVGRCSIGVDALSDQNADLFMASSTDTPAWFRLDKRGSSLGLTSSMLPTECTSFNPPCASSISSIEVAGTFRCSFSMHMYAYSL